ncbi:MAG: zinc-ribbon domain-containing protein, partial [Coriobacteriia bacterium]
MPETRFCGSCGNQLQVGDAFCTACGTPVATQA